MCIRDSSITTHTNAAIPRYVTVSTACCVGLGLLSHTMSSVRVAGKDKALSGDGGLDGTTPKKRANPASSFITSSPLANSAKKLRARNTPTSNGSADDWSTGIMLLDSVRTLQLPEAGQSDFAMGRAVKHVWSFP
eukprot:3770020-Rhodomonas_salina.1